MYMQLLHTDLSVMVIIRVEMVVILRILGILLVAQFTKVRLA